MKIPYECRIEECASTDETRQVIYDLWLDIDADGKGRLISTDGWRMVVLPVETDPEDKAGSVPRSAIDLARDMATDKFPGYDPEGEREKCHRPIFIKLGERAEIGDGISVARPATQYPDWSGNMTKNTLPPEAVQSVSLNAELLVGIQRAFGCTAVTITFQGVNRPMLVAPCDHYEKSEKYAKGVLMPVRDPKKPL